MSSKYFPSFARSKHHKEEPEKAVPTQPVLKEGDEKFLEEHITQDEAPPPLPERPTKITDDGREEEASKEEQQEAVGGSDQMVIPESQSYDDIMKERAAERVKARKAKKRKSLELPSQEEAEASTKGFNAQSAIDAENRQNAYKPNWISLLTTITSAAIRPSSKQSNSSDQTVPEDCAQQRSWKDYASSYVPSIPASWKKGSKEREPEPPSIVYNEDGTINEEKTRSKQAQQENEEREITALLDKLSLEQVNNRVFSFSTETQKIYERFAQVLKDTINGVPTAYDDMDKLFREAGPKLEEQFKSMPPFVQTLVKSLPAKFGSSLGPEILAAASEKPANELDVDIGGRPTTADSGINIPSSDDTTAKEKEKKKRRIPGLKSLLSKEGAVASMLRNVVNFLQTRFPFLASTTNVAMSLAVFSKFNHTDCCPMRTSNMRFLTIYTSSSYVRILVLPQTGQRSPTG